MGPVEIAILADGFRLDPETEGEVQALDLLGQAFDARRDFLFVTLEVAEGSGVVVPLLEPTVIEDEELDPEFLGVPRQFHDLPFVELEVGRFPIVEEDFAGIITEAFGNHVIYHEAVVVGHGPVEAMVAIGKNPIGSDEGFALLKIVMEGLVIKARHDAGSVGGRGLDRIEVGRGIDEVEGIDASRLEGSGFLP